MYLPRWVRHMVATRWMLHIVVMRRHSHCVLTVDWSVTVSYAIYCTIMMLSTHVARGASLTNYIFIVYPISVSDGETGNSNILVNMWQIVNRGKVNVLIEDNKPQFSSHTHTHTHTHCLIHYQWHTRYCSVIYQVIICLYYLCGLFGIRMADIFKK